MIDRILVPLDGSETAEAALAYVELLPSRLVPRFRSKLIRTVPLADPAEWEEWRATREAEGRAYLEQAGERLRQQSRSVEAAFAFGDPADWIIAFAGDAELIVMTTRMVAGRQGGSFSAAWPIVSPVTPRCPLLVRGLTNRRHPRRWLR